MEGENADDFRINFFVCGTMEGNVEFVCQKFEQGGFVNETAGNEDMAQIDTKVFFRGLRQCELITCEKTFANKVFGKSLY